MAKKNEKIDGALRAIEKRFGAGAVRQMSASAAVESVRVLPSGAPPLDEALGVNGYPRGRVVELYGPTEGGAAELASLALVGAQNAGEVCALVDVAHRFGAASATERGVDIAALLVSQPDGGEQGLEIVEALAASGAVGLIVVDSVEALTPRAEIDGEPLDPHVGLQARLMSQALRKLTAVCHRTDTTLLFVNELRPSKAPPGWSSPGGNALKFYASVRLDVRRAADGRVRVKVVKNKCAAPFREAVLDLSAKRFAEERAVWAVLRGEKSEGCEIVSLHASQEKAIEAALAQQAHFESGWQEVSPDRRIWENGCDFVSVERRVVLP
jgi:recombination protein RecA